MHKQINQSENPELSIIIPTLNEQDFLPKLLESISKQDYDRYEVIVADADSQDKTQEIALNYGVKLVKGGMPGVGRNRGAEIAKGKYLFFFDADVILPDGFLNAAISEMKAENIDLATCGSIPISSEPLDPLFFEIYNLSSKISSLMKGAPIMGYVFFITKELFEKTGKFNEKVVFGEDYDLAKRAAKKGKFKILNSVKINVSIRRLDKEGRLNFIIKMGYAYAYVKLFKSIEKEIFDYEFGNFDRKGERILTRKLKVIRTDLKNVYKELQADLKDSSINELKTIRKFRKKLKQISENNKSS